MATADDSLIVALDMPDASKALAVVEELSGAVTFYKVGLELLFGGGLQLASQLKNNGNRVFLDMKLLDIATTVQRAVANIAELDLDFLTIHGHDDKTIKAAVAGRGSSNLKVLAVTVLTSLTADDLKQQGTQISPGDLVLHRARLAFDNGCDGVIASGQEAARIRAATSPDFLIVTPGIRLPGSAANDQERVMTPERAISAGANHIVVGRPITQSDNRAAAARLFQQQIKQARASL